MSNIYDKTTVELFVNGEQPKQKLAELRKSAEELEKSLAEANKAGEMKNVRKLQRQLDSVNKKINQSESDAKGVARVLKNLDCATIAGLNKTLKRLKEEIRATQPNTEEWGRYAEQIKTVKARLKELNLAANLEDLKAVKIAGGNRIAKFATDWWSAVDWGKGILDATTNAVREFVDEFANMEQEMANVRKFTGMTEGQVLSLNEAFKTIDTRTSREQLNQLAQEAGRLGKTSEEDVLGFVRAADKINVALDDLGDGATLTLSKLTGIFGDEDRYGTEQSLLKVGSVINELSQNCAASAPYLTNFAERMGGVGAQANMTIQQIMGLGAVLDSNGQRVEASATAVSQVIVRMLQNPAKYAKVAGLEVKSFTKLLREDTNSALLLFLETLNNAGGMDVLSPMFKDMGENGSRAIAALSTLATNIDSVKRQQQAANEAFAEGVSIDNEFAVQNNTVQASLDKARKRATELRVELGEQLAPLMTHLIHSQSAMAQAMVTTVQFVREYWRVIAPLTVAIAGMTLATKTATIAEIAHTAAVKTKNAVMATGAKLTAIKIAAKKAYTLATTAATGGVQGFTTALRAAKTAMLSTPWGAVAAAIATVVTVLIALRTRTDSISEANKRLSKQLSDTAGSTKNEREEIDRLFSALRRSRKGTEEYTAAKQGILDKYGSYLRGLGSEIEALNNVAAAYDAITEAAERSARQRGLTKALTAAGDAYNETAEANAPAIRQGLKQAEIFGTNNGERISMGKLSEREQRRWSNQIFTESANGGFSDETKQFLKDLGLFVNRAGNWTSKHATTGKDFIDALNALKGAAQTLKQETADAQNLFTTQEDEIHNLQLNDLYAVQKTLQDGYKRAISLTLANGKKVILKNRRDFNSFKSSVDKRVSQLENQYTFDGRGITETSTTETGNKPAGGTGYTPDTSKKDAAARRRADLEAKKGFKQRMEQVRANHETEELQNMMGYNDGTISYKQFLEEKERLDEKYVADRIALYEDMYADEDAATVRLLKSKDADYKSLLSKQAELKHKNSNKARSRNVDDLKTEYSETEASYRTEFADVNSTYYGDTAKQEELLYHLKIQYLLLYRRQYEENSQEWLEYDRQINELEGKHRLETQQRYNKLYEEWMKGYEYLTLSQRQDMELRSLQAMYERKMITTEQYEQLLTQIKLKYAQEAMSSSNGNIDYRSPTEKRDTTFADREAEKKREFARINELTRQEVITAEQAAEAKYQVERYYRQQMYSEVEGMLDAETAKLVEMGANWGEAFSHMKATGSMSMQDVANVAKSSFGVMMSSLQMFGQFAELQSRIDVARTEKAYDAKIKAAQGNAYKTKALEEKKEKEIQKLKAEAARKSFALQVIMATMQMAQNVILGFAAGLMFPFPANTFMPYVLAGIAAAQGAAQIALLNKQRQAAAAEGYAEGGFTRPGSKYEPAGVVHAGEWVASQKLLADPVARPMIEALDYAQRTNTIGRLSAIDVSRAITAPQAIASITEQDDASSLMTAVSAQMAHAVTSLTERLNEPFVTVNTVTGDVGIKSAQDRYTALLKNITPKSKRK